MLIPIILVSLIVYTDKSPVITGAVTAQQEESNILGTYSINPSFKTKIDYDLNDYNKIKELLDFIIKCSEGGKDIETCINKINVKDTSLKWELNCDKGTEKVLYDFAEFYQDCFDSEDTNCLCRKSFEFSDKEIQKFGLVNQIYRLQLNQYKKNKRIEIAMQDPKLSYQINTNELSVWYPSDIVLAYSDKLRSINMIFSYKKEEEAQAIDEYKVLDKKEILLYKNQIDNLKRVDFVEQMDNSFIFPNKQTAATANLPPCHIKPKNIYKFCVTQNKYKFMVYDKLDGQVKERNPVVKFASYIPVPPPPPLTNVEVYDKLKADKSVIIKWDKSTREDVVKYNIYYGKSNLNLFEDKKALAEIKKKEGFNKKELDITKIKPIEVNKIELGNCEFDLTRKGCVYTTDKEGIVLEKEKLYYSKEQNYYFYVLTIEDGIEYDFSVIAIDKNGNEIDNIKDKLPLIKNKKSIDDLPPSSVNIVAGLPFYDTLSKKITFIFGEKPTTNIDDSSLNDFKDYKVYYSKYASLTQEERDKEKSKIHDNELKNLKFIENKNYEQKDSPFYVDLTTTNPEQGNIYFFVIVASDSLGNPKEEQFKVKELGAIVSELIIQ